MRVEVAFETVDPSPPLEVPWESLDPATRYFDLRETPGAVEKIEAARRHPPLRAFLTAINSADSLFATAGCTTWGGEEDPKAEAGPCLFASRVDLVFVPDHFNLHRKHFESLTNRLRELAAERKRFGYRRLHVLLQREQNADGTPRWKVNHKRVYRVYREEGLLVGQRKRKRRASQKFARWRQ